MRRSEALAKPIRYAQYENQRRTEGASALELMLISAPRVLGGALTTSLKFTLVLATKTALKTSEAFPERERSVCIKG
jgi:hypothetical protein